MEAGFVMLEERLGIDLRKHTDVLYVFKDGGRGGSSGLKASTYVVGRNNKPTVMMIFYSEYVVSEPVGYRQTIIHEMKHAGFQGVMGSAYSDLPKWIREGLADGKPYRSILENLTGMPYEDAIAEADAFCRHRGELRGVRAAAQGARSRIERRREGYKKWMEDGGETAFSNWIAANEGHPAEPFARFCLARSFARAGRDRESRELLQKTIKEDGLRCTLRDDAQYWIGVSYNWEQDFEKTAEAFGVLLRDFPSSSAKQVPGSFKPAGPVTEAQGFFGATTPPFSITLRLFKS